MYMTQGLLRASKLQPNTPALVSAKSSFTWSEFKIRVASLAGGLKNLGLKTEDRVAMLSLNSHRYAEFYYGVFWAGGNVVPMNIRWSLSEHIYAINDSEARFIIVDDNFKDIGKSLTEACASLNCIIHASDNRVAGEMINYEDIIENSLPVEDSNRSGEDLAGIFYTGGTTGFPKGVMLPHRALWTSAFCFGHAANVTQRDRVIHAPPLFHIAGSAMLFAVTLFGGSHAFIDGFEPKAFIGAISELNGSMSLLVPTMVTMLLQSPQLEQTDTSKFTRLLYGASPMTLSILKEAMKKLPSTRFIHAYGQTELGPLATILEPEYHSIDGVASNVIRSVGRAVPSVEIEIVDKNGLEVSRGVTGEIKVKGSNTMLGYWKKPAETSETIKNGWVHTGDGGYMDEDGFIYVVDRLKAMIITGGENVYSAEVENTIMQFPGLLECAVIGVPSKKWGEAVHAFVVVRDGVEVREDEIIEFCRTQISSFKCPRTIEIQTDPLPKSAAGKIQKFELRAPFWDGLDRSIS